MERKDTALKTTEYEISQIEKIRTALNEQAKRVAPFYKLNVNESDALLRGMGGIHESLNSLVKETLQKAVEDRTFATRLRNADEMTWRQLEKVSISHNTTTAIHMVRDPRTSHSAESYYAVYADISNGAFIVKSSFNDSQKEAGSESTIGREKTLDKAIELIDARMQQQKSHPYVDPKQENSPGRHLEEIQSSSRKLEDVKQHPYQEQSTDRRVDDTPKSRVKDDLIKLHQFDLAGLEKLNPINDKSQTANIIMQQMGSTADKDFEYAKVLNSVRPDIVKNFASENTYTKLVAIENVDKHYGEKLGSQAKAVEKSNTTAQPSEKGNAEKRDAEHKPIPRKLEEEKQHPYARGREEQSALRSATKVATHMMLGLTGGYLVNKAIDHYSEKKKEAATPSENKPNRSDGSYIPPGSQQATPQKIGGRGR